MRLDAQVTRRTLRQFGLTLAGLIAIFFGFLVPWRFGATLGRWPWIIAGVLALAAVGAPGLLRSIHRGWTLLGHALAWVNVRLLLGLAFFLVFTPFGAIMRLFGRDPLALRLRPDAPSYRAPSEYPAPDEMRRPF